MHRKVANGFTLIELLVVIGIIAAIMIMITPALQKTVIKAKDQAVKSNCAAIEAGLATFAARYGGTYPGMAIDPLAPFGDLTQNLSDPALVGATHPQYPGFCIYGIVGGHGHMNYGALSSKPVHQQIESVRNTVLTPGNLATPRVFDSLILTDSLQDYPDNPFTGNYTSRANRMRNVFCVQVSTGALNDLANAAEVNAYMPPYLNTTNKGKEIGNFANVLFFFYESNEFAWNIRQQPLALPVDPDTFNPEQFSAQCAFGTDDGDYFAEGNFAYVPVLSSLIFPLADDPTTLRNERYQWGTYVTGYMMFGYGSRKNKNGQFRAEQREFVRTGLPGFGAAGVDTAYEELVLELFEGAVYFNKVGV